MTILDKYGAIVTEPDLTRGRLEPERLVIARHPGTPARKARWHYEFRLHPGGGRSAVRVVDDPGSPGREPWEESAQILRYVETVPAPRSTAGHSRDPRQAGPWVKPRDIRQDWRKGECYKDAGKIYRCRLDHVLHDARQYPEAWEEVRFYVSV